jgi:hypothetical protein
MTRPRKQKQPAGKAKAEKAAPVADEAAADEDDDDDDEAEDEDEDEDDDEAEAERAAGTEAAKKAPAAAAAATKKSAPAPAGRAFPTWTELRERIGPPLDALTNRRGVRYGVAIALCLVHLWAFAVAGHNHDLPFDMAPDNPPAFTNMNAQALRTWPREPANWRRLVVAKLDSQHYIGTAVRGLVACPTDPKAPDSAYLDCGLGWLPGWGEVGGYVSRLTGIAADYALMWLSIIAGIALNLLWISQTLIKRLGKLEAWGVLLAFNLYPSAFYVVTPYTEAATLALAIGGFVALSKDRWILAALLIGACTAFRVQTAAFALGYGCALLVEVASRYRAKKPGWWKLLLVAPLAAWGQFLTMIVLQVELGDWKAFLRARKAFGDAHDYGRLIEPTYYLKGFAGQGMDVVIFTAVLAIIVLMARRTLRRFRPTEQTFLIVASVVTVLLTVISPLHYWGITRYMMLCPLAFLAMGMMMPRHKGLFVCWLLLSALFYWHVELCGYVMMGDWDKCPCLGAPNGKEWRMPPGS